MPPATYVEQWCAMYECNWEDDDYRCLDPVANGGEFCEHHQGLKLCKTSGLVYMFGGTALLRTNRTVPPHVVYEPHFGEPPRTKRAQYCSDQCRNLWRDTRNRLARDEAIDKVIQGGPSDRYAIIKNYNNTGNTVVYDKHLHRRLTQL